MNRLGWTVLLLAGGCLAACSKSSDSLVEKPDPDNAMTRYADTLKRDEQRAQDTADRANRLIQRQERQTNEATQP